MACEDAEAELGVLFTRMHHLPRMRLRLIAVLAAVLFTACGQDNVGSFRSTLQRKFAGVLDTGAGRPHPVARVSFAPDQ